MFFKRIILSVFPKPRKRVTWRAALPLAIFLAIFAALCLWLELSDRLLFAHRSRFVLIVVAGWIWWMHVAGFAGLSRGRAVVSLVTRLAMLGLFVMMLAEPRAVRTHDALTVVYAVDISDSVSDPNSQTNDTALKFVAQTVGKKRPIDEAGLIVFGRNAQVELSPKKMYLFEAINSRIDRDATNLEQALSLSAAMLPEESPGRIVLVSDGTLTEGSLSRVLDELKSRDVAVDILPIQYDYDREVWLERLDLPRFVKIGEDYEASIVLSSLKAGKGKLVLRENGEVIYEGNVEFQPGKNAYSVPIKLREPGYYEYAASIETTTEADHLPQNNTVLNYIFVEGEGKVLLVTDPQGDPRDWQPLVQAIRDSQRVVEVRDAYAFPNDSLSLMPYDAIVFVNAPADAFTAPQLEAVEDAVKELGVGFLMVGGPNSFGPGGYHRTPIEQALPVSMDVTKKKILPKGALAIILHTCEFAQGNTWAKRITKQAIKVLGAKDEVGVLAYTEKGEGWIFKLTPASEYEKLVLKINAANIGDMPSFATTMQMGLAELKASDAAARHMIIISDGDPSPPPPPLLQQFIDNQISISTITMFPHGGNDVAMMRTMANATKGRYYSQPDPSQLPSIFIKESKTLRRSMIQTDTITPEAGLDDYGILKGIEGVPPLHGYVLTTAKPRSQVVLKAPVKDDDQLDPILAAWKYGLGTTAAFASDLSTNWGADWVEWDKYRAFVKQLLIPVSRQEKAGNLRLWTYADGNEGVILVEDFHPDESFLQLDARVSGPRDQVQDAVSLKQIGPRRYRGTVPLWGRGRYQVMVRPQSGGDRKDERAHGGFIVPYSPEYLRFRSNPIVLDEIRERTGGRLLKPDPASADAQDPWSTAAHEIYETRRNPKQSSQAIFDWFLIALCCLIPADVAVRRIQIDLYSIKSLLGYGRRSGPSTATMGALLERKKAVGEDLKAERKETPLPVAQQHAAPRRPADVKPAAQQAPPAQLSKPPDKQDDKTTTSRLLDLKRRREQQDEETKEDNED
ncbi:MAG: VWA domain-containing protein [Planctomycetaceae bacterium]